MWQMAIPAAISAVSSIVGGRSAAKKQRQAVGEANRLLGQGVTEGLSDLGSYREMGQRGLTNMGELLKLGRFGAEDFEASPGYQFRLQQGEKALTRNALARGKYFAPSTVKGLTDFNQGMASEEFGNAFERWRAENNDMFSRATTATGVGQRAVESGNTLRSNAYGQMAGNIIGGGNAAAASSMNTANAIGDFANTMGNWWGASNAMARTRRPSQSFGSWRNPAYTGRYGSSGSLEDQ